MPGGGQAYAAAAGYAPDVHGKTGLGAIGETEDGGTGNDVTDTAGRSALDLITEILLNHPTKVTLIPVGPLTNIAMLSLRVLR